MQTELALMLPVQYSLGHGYAQPPFQAYRDDAGWDLSIVRGGMVWPFTGHMFSTGVSVAIPPGHFGLVTSRSSTWHRRRLTIVGSVIDPGYRGEIMVSVFNPTPIPRYVASFSRLAQLIVMPRTRVEWALARALPDADRGHRGYGSSGDAAPGITEYERRRMAAWL